MAKIDVRSVVIDAGPLIHLDELGSLDLLTDFPPTVAPSIVWNEVQEHRPNLRLNHVPGLQVISANGVVSPQLAVLSDTLDLAAGEIAALALAEQHGIQIFLTDDSAARLAGESLGLSVHGSIGILVRSIRTGVRSRTEILDILKNMRQRSTLHISRELLAEIIARVVKG